MSIGGVKVNPYSPHRFPAIIKNISELTVTTMAFESTREGQITEKQLKWGYWWVTHKLQLKALLTIALGVVAFSLLGYAVYGFADWFFGSGVSERAAIGQMASQPTGYLEIQAQSRPTDVTIESARVLISGSDSYDLVSRVVNPNDDWRVMMTWHFEVAGRMVGDPRMTAVLPNGANWLVQLGYKSADVPTGAQLVVDDFAWRRLDKHKVRPDWDSWAGERLDIRFEDVEYLTPAADDPLGVSRVTFNVANRTGYSYWRMGFVVSLMDQGNLVGINRVAVSQLRAGETRPVDATWFSALPRVTEVQVSPEINILDESVYMPVRP